MMNQALQPILDTIEKEVKHYQRKIEKSLKLIEEKQSLILAQEQVIEEAENAQRAQQAIIAQLMENINEYKGAIKALESFKKNL